MRSPPDGYTIGFGQWTSHVGSGALFPITYDLLKDLTPVARLTTAVLWLVGRSDLPPNNLKELIAWLKANPDKATAATIGAGSGTQLCLSICSRTPAPSFSSCLIAAPRRSSPICSRDTST